MRVVWSPTALGQLDEIYDIISAERDSATAAKWFFKIKDAADGLADFPLSGPSIPECAFEDHFTDFAGLRQLVIKPYRIIYEMTDLACNILGVMRTSRLISFHNLGMA